MVLPSVTNNSRRISPRKTRNTNNKRRRLLSSTGLLTIFILFIIAIWACIVLVSPRLINNSNNNSDNKYARHPQKKDRGGRKMTNNNNKYSNTKIKPKRLGGMSNAATSIITTRQKPRVVGMYAYPIEDITQPQLTNEMKKDRDRTRSFLPRYLYLIESIDQNLLSHTSETLRRIRPHDFFSRKTPLSDFVYNYKLAISGSSNAYHIKSEDPLKNLMLTSDSRDMLRSISDDSEDYDASMAEPLNDEQCEATPQQESWMVYAYSTCNFLHEFDMSNDMRKQKTRLLGNGYWRDVWPVLDLEPSTLRHEKKVVLKTIRYEHDYDERNFHRHVRDAIVSERLTFSPRVTSIHAFCGNSGFFDFAGHGSLTDRLEEHWEALYDAEHEREMGRRNGRNDHIDKRLLDKHAKLNISYEIASALADLHDTDAMIDGNGKIISASMVHADISTDQFIVIDGVFRLNDFNRCRFMRRHRNTGIKPEEGDGKPCGFYVGNNPGLGRSPEEYAYGEETEKIDIYSLGNVIYTILTDEIPFEGGDRKKLPKEIKKGARAEIPANILSSVDHVDVVLRNIIGQCWQQQPEDRPRARALADYLGKELKALPGSDQKITK